MDKTYSDLMDIVNRTKKFDSGSKPERKPVARVQRTVKQEEEFAPREYDVEETPKKRKTSSVFGEDSAISKLMDKSTKKTTTKKTASKKTETENKSDKN